MYQVFLDIGAGWNYTFMRFSCLGNHTTHLKAYFKHFFYHNLKFSTVFLLKKKAGEKEKGFVCIHMCVYIFVCVCGICMCVRLRKTAINKA